MLSLLNFPLRMASRQAFLTHCLSTTHLSLSFLFSVRKTVAELISVPIFLYFVCGMLPQPGLTSGVQVCTWDLILEPTNPGPPKWNVQTQPLQYQAGPSHLSLIPMPLFAHFLISFHRQKIPQLEWSKECNEKGGKPGGAGGPAAPWMISCLGVLRTLITGPHLKKQIEGLVKTWAYN